MPGPSFIPDRLAGISRPMDGRRQSRRWRWREAILLLALLVVFLIVLAALQTCLPFEHEPTTQLIWGATFSQKMCGHLGIDWREAYRALVWDLHPASLRLVAYWDLIERRPGRYDFRDLDEQVAEAERAGIPVVIAVGQKVPRWPEYHLPRWLDAGDARERERRLHAYLSVVVARYRRRVCLRYWQVENEPFLAFGKGPGTTPAFLGREVALVRSADPVHPVLTTDGGEWGEWVAASRAGDVFGTTMYRRVYDRKVGHLTYPLAPGFYRFKTRATRFVTGKLGQPFICAELAAEPWGALPLSRMTAEEQRRLFPPSAFADTVAFARATGFGEFYFWGVEWWYYRKLLGDDAYWQAAKAVMREATATPAVRRDELVAW